MNLTDYQTKLTRVQERKRLASESIASIYAKKEKLVVDSTNLEKAHVFIQEVAKETQEHLRFHVEDIVQLGLDSCYPDKYTFRLQFEIKRGQSEAMLVFTNVNGHEVNPMDANGGGLVDIAALSLRMAAWTIENKDNIIILDEAFRFMGSKRILGAAVMRELSERLKLQFIIVTHDKEIMEVADRVFEVVQPDGLYSSVAVVK